MCPKEEDPKMPEHVAWAMRAERTPTNRCQTCIKFPKLVPIIEDLIRLQIAGKTSVSRKQMFAKLAADYKYGLSEASFDRHVNACVLPKISGEKS